MFTRFSLEPNKESCLPPPISLFFWTNHNHFEFGQAAIRMNVPTRKIGLKWVFTRFQYSHIRKTAPHHGGNPWRTKGDHKSSPWAGCAQVSQKSMFEFKQAQLHQRLSKCLKYMFPYGLSSMYMWKNKYLKLFIKNLAKMFNWQRV